MNRIKLADLPEFLLCAMSHNGKWWRERNLSGADNDYFYDTTGNSWKHCKLIEQPADDPISWCVNLGVMPQLPEGLVIEVMFRDGERQHKTYVTYQWDHNWNLHYLPEDIIAWRIVGADTANDWSDELELNA